MDHVHNRRAIGAEHWREREDDGPRDLTHVASNMGGPASAKGKDIELARAVAPKHNLLADGRTHLLVHHPPDQCRCLYHIQAKRVGDLLLDCLLCSSLAQAHLASEVEVGIDVAEDEISIRYRGLRAAQVVGGRSRVGASALRTYLDAVAQITV